MIAKFPGTCRNCRERFSAGIEINWSKDNGATHVSCGQHAPAKLGINPDGVQGVDWVACECNQYCKACKDHRGYFLAFTTGYNRWFHYAIKTETTLTPAPRPEKPEELLPGVYETDENIYVVRLTRDKERTYACKMVDLNTGRRLTETDQIVAVDFVYDKGAIFNIKPEHRMSLERAKELSIRYGRCLVCTRHLKAAKSVDAGMGPVCIKTQLGVRIQKAA